LIAADGTAVCVVRNSDGFVVQRVADPEAKTSRILSGKLRKAIEICGERIAIG
jgi:hypothetical protein